MTRKLDSDRIPSALDRFADLTRRIGGRRFAVFLDYDGTLTPIVERPELAILSDKMRTTVAKLAARCPVAVISGRDLPDVARLVGLESVYYAGSHGFDISGPGECRMQNEGGMAAAPSLRAAELKLRTRLSEIPGALVEGKAFAVAVHYRLVSNEHVIRVKEAVDIVAAQCATLRVAHGKKVVEIRPRVEWDKGRAVFSILRALDLDLPRICPIYLGDDLTDEDAFEALTDLGIGILVRNGGRKTSARYALENTDEVQRFLDTLVPTILPGTA